MSEKQMAWLQLYAAILTGLLASGNAQEQRTLTQARDLTNQAMNVVPGAITEVWD